MGASKQASLYTAETAMPPSFGAAKPNFKRTMVLAVSGRNRGGFAAKGVGRQRLPDRSLRLGERGVLPSGNKGDFAPWCVSA